MDLQKLSILHPANPGLCPSGVKEAREILMLLPWQRVSPNLVGGPGKGEVSGVVPAAGTAQGDGDGDGEQQPQGQFQPGTSFPGRVGLGGILGRNSSL